MEQINAAPTGIDPNIICQRPGLLSGAAVFPRTRIPVRFLLNTIVGGGTIEDFVHDYPAVSVEQAQSVLEFVFERTIGPRSDYNIVR